MQLSWQGALCEPSTVGVDTRVHLTNLVIAARNVLRIGAIARDVDGVAAALQSFDDKVQNVTRVRDILEHFDDYHLGRGKLQRQGTTVTSTWA